MLHCSKLGLRPRRRDICGQPKRFHRDSELEGLVNRLEVLPLGRSYERLFDHICLRQDIICMADEHITASTRSPLIYEPLEHTLQPVALNQTWMSDSQCGQEIHAVIAFVNNALEGSAASFGTFCE